MKKNHILIIFILFVALVAVLTNPNQDRHKEVIKNRLKEYLQTSMEENAGPSTTKLDQAGKALGVLLGGVLIDRIADNLVSTDNYVLFSITKLTWEGKTKVIGIGAFGNVFLTRELDDTLHKGLLSNP